MCVRHQRIRTRTTIGIRKACRTPGCASMASGPRRELDRATVWNPTEGLGRSPSRSNALGRRGGCESVFFAPSCVGAFRVRRFNGSADSWSTLGKYPVQCRLSLVLVRRVFMRQPTAQLLAIPLISLRVAPWLRPESIACLHPRRFGDIIPVERNAPVEELSCRSR